MVQSMDLTPEMRNQIYKHMGHDPSVHHNMGKLLTIHEKTKKKAVVRWNVKELAELRRHFKDDFLLRYKSEENCCV